jgi:hypothetical protein
VKIAYVIDIKKDNRSIGVLKKIEAQVSEWRRLGHSVDEIYLFDFCPGLNKRLILLPKKISTILEVYINSFLMRNHFKVNKYDAVYSRALFFTPFIFCLKKCNYIMELNANDLDQYKKTSLVRYIYSFLTRSFVYSLPKGFVAVSNEIKSYYSSFGKQTLVVANACPDLNLPERIHFLNRRPVIGFIGSSQFAWNGNEKVLHLASCLPDYDFEIIGFHLEKTTPNVKTFGFLTEDESIQVMKRWNAAISTLSLYEQNLTEASPLKSRLYLAMNIPFIYAYDDTDEPFSHCLKIPNTPDNIESNFNEIDSFFKYVFELNPTKLSHDCSLETKERKRLNFLEQFAKAK